jgi:oxygen-independent coproporphyrinogen-3 oxidase
MHNSNYWKGISYLGVGPSAHSFNGSKRRWNVSNNTKYLKQFDLNAYFEEESLTLKDQWNEIVMTGLRTTYGVAIEQLTALFPLDEAFQQTLHSFQKDGMLVFSNNHLSLTDKGRLQADYIASEFFKV